MARRKQRDHIQDITIHEFMMNHSHTIPSHPTSWCLSHKHTLVSKEILGLGTL